MQAAVMQDVYQHATLNIAATAAQDGDIGVFHRRDPMAWALTRINVAWRFIPFDETFNVDFPRHQSYLCKREITFWRVLDEAPLNRRAWVMQERHLSRRIAHYTDQVLVWECHEALASEVHPDGFLADGKDKHFHNLIDLKRLMNPRHQIDQRDDRREMLYKAWEGFRYSYSACQLTYPEDKLIALSGVAQSLSDLLQDELVAGLWRARFVEQLCWYVTPSDDVRVRPTTWRAPSWTWASTESKIHQIVIGSRARREMVQIMHLDTHVKASGALISCSVKLKCKLVNAIVHLEKTRTYWGQYVFFSDDTLQSPENSKHLLLFLDDPEFWTAVSGRRSIKLLVLMSYKDQYDATFLVGIALVSSTSHRGAYERIGFFKGPYQIPSPFEWFFSELAARHEKAEEQIIKLV